MGLIKVTCGQKNQEASLTYLDSFYFFDLEK
jgi:hypothetical protein